MNTRFAHFGFAFNSPRASSSALLRTVSLAPSATAIPAVPGLLERLAAWYERQPRHHRLGSWTCVG